MFSNEAGKKGMKNRKKKHNNNYGHERTLEVSSREKREVVMTDS